jgi:hypothetical protein
MVLFQIAAIIYISLTLSWAIFIWVTKNNILPAGSIYNALIAGKTG